MTKIIVLFTAVLFLVQCTTEKQKEIIIDYVGQTPPDRTPVIFAPGIISADSTVEHGPPAFSPDGKEVYWQSNYRQIGKETEINGWMMKRENNKWSKPIKTPMGKGPVFSTDGSKLYYGIQKDKTTRCYSEKTDTGWSEHKELGLLDKYPELKYVYQVSFAQNGNVYFLGFKEGYKNNFALFKSEYKNGEYQQPELLPIGINTPGDTVLNWTPYIAPDESYLIYSRRVTKPVRKGGNLFISFRNSDGSWSNGTSLGSEINSEANQRYPLVSPDGKYLFFTEFVAANNEEIFWVSADRIYEMKEEYFKGKM